MKVMETEKPTYCNCCGKPAMCPCFQRFKNTCLFNYCKAILADIITDDSASRDDSFEACKKLTKTTSHKNVDRNPKIEDFVVDINKITCPRCLVLYKRTFEATKDENTDPWKLCDHCRIKAQNQSNLRQEKIQKLDKQKKTVCIHTKLTSRSESNLLDSESSNYKNVNYKAYHELEDLYQSSTFRPVSNVTVSGKNMSRDDVQFEYSKIRSQHGEKPNHISRTKYLSEPTLMAEERDEKLKEYQKALESNMKTITGFDKEMVYSFPKSSKIEIKRHVSTSELIRDTRAKESKRLEEAERKRLEHEEKKRLAEEKRRQDRERLEEKNKSSDQLKKEPKEQKIEERAVSKEPKEPKEPKAPKEPKEPKEPKAPKEPKEPKPPKEPQESKPIKEPKAPKEPKEPKPPKEPQESKPIKEPKVPREPKPLKEPKESKEPRVPKNKSEKDLGKMKVVLDKDKDVNVLLKGQQREKENDDLDNEIAKLREQRERDRMKQQPAPASTPERPTTRETEKKKVKKSKPKSPRPKIFENPTPESTLENDEWEKPEIENIIIMEIIHKYKPPTLPPDPLMQGVGEKVIPMFFKSKHADEPLELTVKPNIEVAIAQREDREKKEVSGVIKYSLSDRSFIEKGWTVLPVEKVVRKMNVYRMRPAQPEFDWFQNNKNKGTMTYDSGDKLAEFDNNGRGRWYYRNGRLALDYYDAEEINAQQRYVVYSNGEPDERGRSRPVTVLATFDYQGNGVVFDHTGKIRLKYNQTDGIVLDRSIGPVTHWKWHTLNDPPVLQQVMIDTQMPQKDPKIFKMGGPSEFKTRAENEEMLAIEFDNFIKEKSKKMSQSFKPFQIRMKALKINENFSLKVLDQANIYLIFRDGSTNLKQNIGMVLDPQEIVDTDIAELGEVASNMERFPARTDSIAALQSTIAHAQHYEKTRTERERMLRPLAPCLSADYLTAAQSKPLRRPLNTIPSLPSRLISGTGSCKCSRKPAYSNVYYNSRLY